MYVEVLFVDRDDVDDDDGSIVTIILMIMICS